MKKKNFNSLSIAIMLAFAVSIALALGARLSTSPTADAILAGSNYKIEAVQASCGEVSGRDYRMEGCFSDIQGTVEGGGYVMQVGPLDFLDDETSQK